MQDSGSEEIEMLLAIGPDGQPVYCAIEPADSNPAPGAARQSSIPALLILLLVAGALLLTTGRLK